MRFDDRKFFLLVLYSLHIVRKFIRYKTEMIANFTNIQNDMLEGEESVHC
jgi:hypothetical protein